MRMSTLKQFKTTVALFCTILLSTSSAVGAAAMTMSLKRSWKKRIACDYPNRVIRLALKLRRQLQTGTLM